MKYSYSKQIGNLEFKVNLCLKSKVDYPRMFKCTISSLFNHITFQMKNSYFDIHISNKYIDPIY